MSSRIGLFALLIVMAGAAAVLSFAALRDLAVMCGFSRALAWLLPVVVDTGAAAGSLVWRGNRAQAPAQRFARALALGLLTISVAANALGHGLEAFRVAPPWWVVVIVSAVAPSVLGAVVHLAVLVGRPEPSGWKPEVGGSSLRTDTERDLATGHARSWSPDPSPSSTGADAEGRPRPDGGGFDRRRSRPPPSVPRTGDERIRGPSTAGAGPQSQPGRPRDRRRSRLRRHELSGPSVVRQKSAR